MHASFARTATADSARSSNTESSVLRLGLWSAAELARACTILSTHASLLTMTTVLDLWAAKRAKSLSGVTLETRAQRTDRRSAFEHGGERAPAGFEENFAAEGALKRAFC